MKSPTASRASHNLLGALLLLSVLGTAATTSGLDGLTDLLAACKSQWQAFAESLSMMQPHRTAFPH